MKKFYNVNLFLVLALSVSFLSFSYNDKTNKYRTLSYNGGQLLNEFLINEANKQFEERKKKIANAIEDSIAIKEYISSIRKAYSGLLKEFPDKTPLNPKVTGTIPCEGYRIEKILYESRSNHYVTGNLYIPTFKEGPFPAVLETCGHSINAKARDSYQELAVLFALNGFVVFVIDTYGQGEMYQIHDSLCNLAILEPTVTHTQLDIGAMLTGTDMNSYIAWNNIRAIDYLCSRPEVDQERIGITGNSGGGTQALYLMGIDSRIKVIAPSCGVHTRERMFTLNGPADGCQNLFGEGCKMLEYSDYIILSVPKPVLVLAGEKDPLFDINAVSQCVREAKWFYKKLGFLDHVQLFTADKGHGFHMELREAAVWWFKKWLMQDESSVAEPKLTLQEDKALWVTQTGQVLDEFKKRESVTDLNIGNANRFAGQRKEFWRENNKQVCLSKVKELINYTDRSEIKNITGNVVGEIDEKEYKIKKITILARDSFPLPALLYIPRELNYLCPATLCIDPKGKENLFNSGSESYKLLRKGRMVLAVDLRGFGETTDDPGKLRKNWRLWNEEFRIAQTSFHIGKPLLGQRVQDVIDAFNYLCTIPNVNNKDISLVGIEQCGIIALHAAAIDSGISDVRIIRSVSSLMDIVKEPLSKNHLSDVVPGALEYYDLPDLVNAIKPRRVTILEPLDAFGNKLK